MSDLPRRFEWGNLVNNNDGAVGGLCLCGWRFSRLWKIYCNASLKINVIDKERDMLTLMRCCGGIWCSCLLVSHFTYCSSVHSSAGSFVGS